MHKRLKKKTTEIFSATKTLQHLCTAHTQSEDPITIVHHRKTVCVYNIKRWRYGGNIWIIHFAIVDATCYLYVLYSNIYKKCAFNVIRSYICIEKILAYSMCTNWRICANEAYVALFAFHSFSTHYIWGHNAFMQKILSTKHMRHLWI